MSEECWGEDKKYEIEARSLLKTKVKIVQESCTRESEKEKRNKNSSICVQNKKRGNVEDLPFNLNC